MIERLYPGVYLAEVAFKATPIDGVPTTQPSAAPAWTEPNTHDPGVTLLELLNYSALDAFALDLSAVSSKYVGETGKNLNAVFGEAPATCALLRCDDAGTLFGDRD